MTTILNEELDICINAAYRYIFKRPKTNRETTIHLRSKWHSDDIISSAIEILKRKKYIDDTLFVEMFLESELIKKWRPAVIIMQKLMQRGIDKNLIKERMSKHEENIQEWLHKRIDKEISKYKARWVDGFDIIQKLMKKGFRLHDIKSVVQQRKQEE